MIIKFLKSLCGFFLLLTVVACANQIQPVSEIGEMSRDDFMNAMRWKQFKVAAELMLPEYRNDFMAACAKVKGIHITDVRLMNLRNSAEGRRFETTIEMDYYLLPSVSVKTFSFDQTWVFFDGDNDERKGFLIITSFPGFP